MKYFSLFAALLLSGCQLISQYDPATDEGVTSIHYRLTDYVQQSSVNGDAAGITPEQSEFYRGVKADLHTLRIRAASIPQNTLTTEQLDILRGIIDNLETLDTEGFTAQEAAFVSTAVDRACQAILKLELAKKR